MHGTFKWVNFTYENFTEDLEDDKLWVQLFSIVIFLAML